MSNNRLTTGMEEIDRLIGGVLPGDNLVWEVDSGAPVGKFISNYISACEKEGAPVIFVSFNRSPQTITNAYSNLMSSGQFKLIDCFSSGKGNNDEIFLEYFHSMDKNDPCRPIQVRNPSDHVELLDTLRSVSEETSSNTRYVFDSLTGMFDVWNDEDAVLRFFGHFCPRLFDINTVGYWLLEKEAHSERFLAKLRHITQVVVEIAVSRGIWALTLRKAVNRRCADIGVPQWFRVIDEDLVIAPESREDRELGLLTRMSELLGTALSPQSFFDRTMETLADELGMVRGTLLLLDRTSKMLRIIAAHGLSSSERRRAEYAQGEGVTGHVAETGVAEVIADISKDSRFLNRTAARKTDMSHPIAFICVPIKVDGEVVGVLSIDRLFAVDSMLDKDLRLLLIVASIISQVLKINHLIHIEKEEILARDNRVLNELRNRYRLENLVGQSEAIEQVLSMAATAAKSQAAIVITGETGTGKELVANVVHYNSGRANGPLIKVNCGALPETLLESELFGHVKGAFTGALETRKGRFELADGGTLFLDEVAEMSPRLQVKLLRVLQEKEFEPVGGTKTLRVDVRIVAATSKNLREEIRAGRFRKDLFYRLNVIPIHLPPLRERRKDIPLLVDYFMDKYNLQNGRNVRKISPKVLSLLLEYYWPGNVRELENCVERGVVMSPGEALSVDFLPDEVKSIGKIGNLTGGILPENSDIYHVIEDFCDSTDNLGESLKIIHSIADKAIISKALSVYSSQRQIAEKLGISRMTLRKKIREYNIKK